MRKKTGIKGKFNNCVFYMTILLALYVVITGFYSGFTPETLYRILLMILMSYLLISKETNESRLWKVLFTACFLKELTNILIEKQVWYYVVPDILCMTGLLVVICTCEKKQICENSHKTIRAGAGLVVLSKMFNIGVFLFETYTGTFVYISNLPVYRILINILICMLPELFAFFNPNYISYSNEKNFSDERG